MFKRAQRVMVCGLLGLALLSGGCQEGQSLNGSLKIEYHYTKTDDGITLAMRRYQPAKLSSKKQPVILCHGLSYNLLFWDIAQEVSLARHLASHGYDVWSLSLRGACPSSQPIGSALQKLRHFGLDPEFINKLTKPLRDVPLQNWTVDDHIMHDVPCALAFVKEKTGHDRVHWVGHSMGGMVMFGYLGQGYDTAGEVKSFVALSVPMAILHPLSQPMQFLLDAEGALSVGSVIVGSSAPATMGALVGDTGNELDRMFFNGANTDTSVIQRLNQVVGEDMSPGQLKQLLDMVRSERFHSVDGSVDYTAGLSNVRTPICFFVGTVDNMATPGAVRYAYREVASSDKEFHIFGRVNKHKADYGHDDIVIGRHAMQEVYPTILNWLQRHPAKVDETKLMLQPALPDSENTAGCSDTAR